MLSSLTSLVKKTTKNDRPKIMNDEQKDRWENDGSSVIHHFIHELIHSDEFLHYALIAYLTGKNKTKKNDARAAFL